MELSVIFLWVTVRIRFNRNIIEMQFLFDVTVDYHWPTAFVNTLVK